MMKTNNPIQVGDFLEVTQEYLDYLQDQRIYGSQLHLGTWLKTFHINSQTIRACQGESWQYPVPYDMALRMRDKADATNPANVARRVIQLEGENLSLLADQASLVMRIQEYVTRLYGDIGTVTPSGSHIILNKSGITKLLKQRFEEMISGWWLHSVICVDNEYVVYLISKHPDRRDPIPTISLLSNSAYSLDELEFTFKHLVARAMFKAEHAYDSDKKPEKFVNDTSLPIQSDDDDDSDHIEDENIY